MVHSEVITRRALTPDAKTPSPWEGFHAFYVAYPLVIAMEVCIAATQPEPKLGCTDHRVGRRMRCFLNHMELYVCTLLPAERNRP
jgi:hypothetical protein